MQSPAYCFHYSVCLSVHAPFPEPPKEKKGKNSVCVMRYVAAAAAAAIVAVCRLEDKEDVVCLSVVNNKKSLKGRAGANTL